MFHPFELTLTSESLISPNEKAKVSYAPTHASRIDGFATRGAADVDEVRIHRSERSKEMSGRIDHTQIPWPMVDIGDLLEVTLKNHRNVSSRVAILLRGVVVS